MYICACVTCSIEYVYSKKFCDSELLHSGACYRLQTMSITKHEQVSPTQKLQLVSLELHLTFKGGCREGKDQSEKREKSWNSEPLLEKIILKCFSIA